ncbi:MAG: efflux RND transporter permease subunit, partial [Bacteroidales bacterium]
VSTVLSGVCALTLTPALCAILLKTPKENNFFIFRYFNKYFGKLTNIYTSIVTTFLKHKKVTLLSFAFIAGAAMFGFLKWPTTFVPSEDLGYFMVSAQLPDGASLHETKMSTNYIEKNILDSLPGVKSYLTIDGFSMVDGAQISNFGSFVVILEDWSKRQEEERSVDALVAEYNKRAYNLQSCNSFAFSPPAITGLGTSGGFEFVLQDRSKLGSLELQKMATELCQVGNTQSGLSGLRNTFRASIPQRFVKIDRDKIKALHLSMSDVFATLASYMGSAYVNDFVKFGRTYQVKIQSNGESRSVDKDVLKLSVRNAEGQMVPFSAFAVIDNTFGPELLQRYNMYTSTIISGNPAPGKSSGEAIAVMESMSKELLGNHFSSQWTSMAYQEKAAASSTAIIFALAILVAFLVLSAQYESWTSPIAVIMGLPIALLGVIIGCMLLGLPISVYTQIGIVLLIGLSAKNAILIVEFARDFRATGKSIDESAIEAGRVRFRPILMTSIAFILGVFPLVVATGAGAASRVSLGVAVFFGMLATVFIGTLFIPNFYSLWQNIQEKYLDKKKK